MKHAKVRILNFLIDIFPLKQYLYLILGRTNRSQKESKLHIKTSSKVLEIMRKSCQA